MNPIIFFLTVCMIILPSCGGVGRRAAHVDQTEECRDKGIAYLQAQQYPEALEYFIKGMESARASDDSYAYISCLGNIGSVYGAMGNYERSLYYQNLAYLEAVEYGDTAMQSELLVNLVGSSCAAGKAADAEKYMSMQLRRPMPDKSLAEFYRLYNSALIARLDRRYMDAMSFHDRAAGLAMERGDSARAISQYLGQAECRLHLEDTVEAGKLARKAASMAVSIHNLGKQRDAYRVLESVFQGLHRNDSVEKYGRLARAADDTLFNRGREMLATNRHLAYENKITADTISGLHGKIRFQTLLLVFIITTALIMAVATILIYLNMRKLRKSQRLIVSQNRELEASEERARKLLAESVAEIRDPDTESLKDDREENRNGSGNTVMTQTQYRTILGKIMEIMANPEVLHNPSFSLNTLADMVGVNSKYVSWVIKESHGKNFKTFVNERRIREACRRLENPEYANLTIQAIYLEVGFKSPATFNEAFKRMTGMTPSAYQKRAAESGRP